jgi:hypothetical protein
MATGIRRYLPHIIYSVALTSISFHLLFKRDRIDTQRAQLSAQISVLESVVQQLQSRESVSDVELERLMKLARANGGYRENLTVQDDSRKRVVSWKDAIFGRERDQSKESGERE